MRPPDIVDQRLIALFLLGGVLFNFPLLSIFNRAETLFGIPLLYIYIFSTWVGVIGVTAWIVKRRG